MATKRSVAALAVITILAGTVIADDDDDDDDRSNTVRARTTLFDAGPESRFAPGIVVRGSVAREVSAKSGRASVRAGYLPGRTRTGG